MIEFASFKNSWKALLQKGDEAFAKAHLLDQDQWPMDGLFGADAYEVVFEMLMEEKSFEEWAEKRKAAGLTTHVVDLFGGAYLFDDFTHVDSVTGVRLFNQDQNLRKKYISLNQSERLDRLEAITSNQKRQVLEGNLFHYSTWKKLKQSVLDHGAEKVDLIIARPLAGVDAKQNFEGLKVQFLQSFKRAYALLSNNDGIFLTSVSLEMVPFASHMFHLLSKVTGITVDYDSESKSYKITKGREAPERLALEDYPL